MIATIISALPGLCTIELINIDVKLDPVPGQPCLITKDESAANSAKYAEGLSLPKRFATVLSEVLADLLSGKRVRAMDTVFSSSTTRLAAKIHTLGNTRGGKYGWPIQRRDVYIDTRDGRNTPVTEYWLSDEAINHGVLIGSAEFCSNVRDARALARANSAASR